MRIELSPKAKTAFTDIAARKGMTQVAVTSRMIEWLVRQPDMIQLNVLQSLPVDNGEQSSALLTAILKHIIDANKSA